MNTVHIYIYTQKLEGGKSFYLCAFQNYPKSLQGFYVGLVLKIE
jgi:hypothetical protein